MIQLDNFVGMMTGHFDNKEQFDMMQATGKIYPYAEHVNTVCKIFLRISMVNLLLKKVIMRPTANAMRHHIFFLLPKMRREFCFPHMKFQKEKTKIHFHTRL